MPIIKAKRYTLLKRRDVQSTELPASEIRVFREGSTLAVTRILPANGQSLIVEISGDSKTLNLKNREQWFIYAPDWDGVGIIPFTKKPVEPNSIRLQVPYFAQNDTKADGWRYCFSHACAMAAFFLKPSLFDDALENRFWQPEQYYISKLSGDTTNPDSQLDALEALGLKAYYTQTVSPTDLYGMLLQGVPIPVGISYKSSGHWITCVGRKGDNWLMHDPYGIRSGTQNFYAINSTDQNQLGKFDVYSQAAMDTIYWDLATDARKESGWAIIITHVDGKQIGSQTRNLDSL